MAGSKGNTSYNTYILGSAKNITDCLNIILYNKSILTPEDNVEKINIYNISSVIQSLERIGKYIKLSRESSEEVFNYRAINDVIPGFDVVIYLGTDGAGLGYTEFINVQGKYRDINITIDSRTEVEGTLNIDVVNSLNLANSTSYKTDWIGDDEGEYTSAKRISEWKNNSLSFSPSAYTTHLTALDIYSSKGESGIWLGGLGYIQGSNQQLSALNIAQGFIFDSYSIGFNKHYIGLYTKSDISYYTWTGLKYSISSLSSTNRFGYPIKHTESEEGYVSVKGDGVTEETHEILGWSGRYAIVNKKGTEDNLVWDTLREKFLPIEGKVFVDETSPNFPTTLLPTTNSTASVLELVPDLTNTFYDIDNYGSRNSINILFRKGNWFVFRQGDLIVWSNLRQSITTTWDELHKVVIINDLYLGIVSDESDAFIIYTGLGQNWMTELARQRRSGGSLSYDSGLGIYKASDLENSKYNQAYIENTLRVCKGIIPRTQLMSFRRGPYNSNGYPKASKVIGGFMGLIFYNFNGKIYYL